ncbi:hypothetical protein OAO01_01310 [Oligoflexia bacterium]|nr:hypothetical protein [Oligoflexia bacterium]
MSSLTQVMPETNQQANFTLFLSLASAEIKWPEVCTILVRDQELSKKRAKKLIKAFSTRLDNLFEISWYQERNLNDDTLKVVSAICIAHKSDSVTLYNDRGFKFLGTAIKYRQSIKFANLKTVSAKLNMTCEPLITLTIGNKRTEIKDTLQVAAFRLLLFMAAVLMYVVVVGIALYSAAVYLMFEQMPLEVIRVGLEQPFIGMGLLIAFCVIAASLGKIFSYPIKWLYKLLRRGKR